MIEDNQNESFAAEMGDIKPFKQDKVVAKNTQRPSLNAKYRQKVAQSFGARENNFLTDGEVAPVEPEEILSFKVSGVQPDVFKRLRLGKYTIDYHIDLHRKTVAESRHLVYQLLRNAEKNGFRTLLITHGKGIMSTPPARLKSYVNQWLQQVDRVIGYHSAIPRHGGSGSVYVLLKKPAVENRDQDY